MQTSIQSQFGLVNRLIYRAMAVPKKKTSTSKRGMRRSHLALKPVHLSIDKETGDWGRSHHLNPKTGKYKGEQIVVARGVESAQ